jgi:hypothetical protein
VKKKGDVEGERGSACENGRRAAQCKREVERLTQNSGLSCSFSTRRGNDYDYGGCTELTWARNRQVRLCISTWLNPSTPLHSTPLHSQKSAQHRIDSFVLGFDDGNNFSPLLPFMSHEKLCTIPSRTRLSSNLQHHIASKPKIPNSNSSPPSPPQINTQFLSSSKVCFTNFLKPVSSSR